MPTGLLKSQNGAIVADLNDKKLGTCVLLKSDGSGLYATKDLTLASKKFLDYNIERSIYVVDVGQTLHFQQVFEVLNQMGFEQAQKCFHLSYGLVVLPNGKMSSRKGTVICFSELQNMMNKQIEADFLVKYKDVWPAEEIDEARRAIAVATIKYGMLNHDTAKDIVFELSEWAAKSGNTGPYMMYAYARCQAIIREVGESIDDSAIVDYSLLSQPTERAILMQISEFWMVVSQCAYEYRPTVMCSYIFELAKKFSSWYEATSVKNAETPELKAARANFVKAIGQVLKRGLETLGISTIERM